MKNILLLGATFGTGNMGVGALTAGALTIMNRRFPQARVSLLDYGREPVVTNAVVEGAAVSVPLINLRFSWKLFLANNVATLLAASLLGRSLGEGARRRLIQHNAWLRGIERADVAVAVSGGDSFSDIYGLGRLFYVCLPQLLAVTLGVKLILLPQTIGPFRTRPARWIAGYLMRRASLVFSRDTAGVEESRRLLQGAGLVPHARFCPDMGFVVEPRRPTQLDLGGFDLRREQRQRPLVGLNVSGLLWMGGYNKDNMFDLSLNYRELIERLIAYFVDGRHCSVLLVPHVFGSQGESDSIAASVVEDEFSDRYGPNLWRARGTYDQNEIKYIIGQCDFFVGARMHACIAALSQGIPAVGVAYSDKFSGVFDSVGAAEMVVDPRCHTVDEVIAAVAKAFDRRGATQASLRHSMPLVKAQVLALLDDVT